MSTDPNTLTITPDVTVGDLLQHYPQLEEPLACLVPAYGALSTPALRLAVGRTLTLHNLATNGGVPIGKLITDLRAAAGVEETAPDAAVPPWATDTAAAVTLDARPVLAAGGHPLGAVMQGLADLAPGEVYQMLTPFVPAPLIEMARSRGFEAFIRWDGDIVRTYFRSANR